MQNSVILIDADGNLWAVTVDDNGTLHTNSTLSGSPVLLIVNDPTASASWMVTASTAGILGLTRTGLSSSYPQGIALASSSGETFWKIGVTVGGSLTTNETLQDGPILLAGLRAAMLQTSAVTAIIGTPQSRPDGKAGVWCVQMPEEADLPGIVLSTISGEGNPSLDGADPLHYARVQISCFAMTFAQAKALARAVRNALEGWAGTLPDGTQVGDAILVSEPDGFEEGPFSFHCPVDFEFQYSEA